MEKFLKFVEKNYFIFIVYAFLGWIYEVSLYLIRDHVFVNRGFLLGPYLPIYGFGALILYYLIYKFAIKKHKIGKVNITPVLVFIIIFIVTTVVEYIAHFVLDEYFGIILWDYTNDYWNINGRVCFEASRNFAIVGTVCLYFVQPLLENKLFKLKDNYQHILFVILFIPVIVDFIIKII